MPTANLSLYVQARTDGLHRVVTVCRRRNVEILALTYSDSQISLEISGDDRQVRQIDRWLAALVDVFDVKVHEPPDGVRVVGTTTVSPVVHAPEGEGPRR
jgi:acetolactate synthase small subunit